MARVLRHPWLWFLPAAALLVWRLFPVTVDDAFISFRYAENLARGLGPVFNPGERIEGYSNPSWVLLLSLPARFLDDLLIPAKLMSLCCWLGTAVLLARLARRRGASPHLALALYLGSLPAMVWGVSGMEMPLQSLLLLALLVFLERPAAAGASWPPGRQSVFAGLCLLCLLTRPESPLHVAAALAAGWRRGPGVWTCAALALGAGSALALRFGYYGAWLPNTFAAKSWQTWGHLHVTVKSYLVGYAWQSGLVLVILGSLTLRRLRADAFLRGAWALAAAQVSFVLYSGGDWMPAWRFLVPAIPLFCLLAALGAAALQGRFRFAAFAASAAALVHAGLNFSRDASISEGRLLSRHWPSSLDADFLRRQVSYGNPEYAETVAWLKRHPAIRSLAVGEAGYFCYYTRLPCRDLHGLTDTVVARSRQLPSTVIGKVLPLWDSAFPATELGRYVASWRADAFILSRAEMGSGIPPLLAAEYRLVHRNSMFRVLARKDVP